MKSNLTELNNTAGQGVQKLLDAGIPLSEIFQYEISGEQFEKFQQILKK